MRNKVEFGISIDHALDDHEITGLRPKDFLDRQTSGAQRFVPQYAHHAEVGLVQDPRTSLILVKKRFGAGETKLPFSIAQELTGDYVIHERRLREVGVRVATTYDITLDKEGPNGVITAYQMFIPDGTLIELLNRNQQPNSEIRSVINATITDTVTPALDYYDPRIKPNDSWVFNDVAPKNVAPFTVNDCTKSFLIDLYVPRVRLPNGEVKLYGDFNPHTRSEAEMQRRFFTKPGILNNFLGKMRAELDEMPSMWNNIAGSIGDQLGSHLQRYFPGMSVNEIARLSLSDASIQDNPQLLNLVNI